MGCNSRIWERALQSGDSENSLSPKERREFQMTQSEVSICTQFPTCSQDIRDEVNPEDTGHPFDSLIPIEALALNNLVSQNPSGLSAKQHFISGRTAIERDVRQEVERRLRAGFGGEFHAAKCDIREGILFLCGNVSSFYTKQLAQEIARKVNGVNLIVNRLRVDHS